MRGVLQQLPQQDGQQLEAMEQDDDVVTALPQGVKKIERYY